MMKTNKFINRVTQKTCPYPKINLSIMSSEPRICCWNNINIFGTKKNKLSDFWHNKSIIKARKQIETFSFRCPGFCPILNQCSDIFYPAHPSQSSLWSERYINWPSLCNEGGPIIMQIDYDNFCNIRCTMCNNRIEKTSKPNIDTSYLEKWVIEAADNDPNLLILIQGGEPFYSQNSQKFVHSLNKQRPEIKWGFITNALCWEEKKIRDLLIAGMIVSCDGATKNTYEKIRIGATFELFKRKLTDIIWFTNGGIPLQLNFTVMTSNIEEMNLAADIYGELGVKKLRFCPVLLPIEHNEFIFSKPDSIEKFEKQCSILRKNHADIVSNEDLNLLQNMAYHFSSLDNKRKTENELWKTLEPI